jgi:hypothetical protein
LNDEKEIADMTTTTNDDTEIARADIVILYYGTDESCARCAGPNLPAACVRVGLRDRGPLCVDCLDLVPASAVNFAGAMEDLDTRVHGRFTDHRASRLHGRRGRSGASHGRVPTRHTMTAPKRVTIRAGQTGDTTVDTTSALDRLAAIASCRAYGPTISATYWTPTASRTSRPSIRWRFRCRLSVVAPRSGRYHPASPSNWSTTFWAPTSPNPAESSANASAKAVPAGRSTMESIIRYEKQGKNNDH